ncbi:MAG: hypothetical protein LBS78_00780, partial [Endomicrobium sp.]|nr:hypothetical protein [Endomicrobium sp.]
CTNASLNALAGCVFLSGWGNDGFKNLAEVNMSKARYAFNKIRSLDGFKAKFKDRIFFNEFVIETQKDIKKMGKKLFKSGILGPLNLSHTSENLKNCLLFCVTEKRSKLEINKLVEVLAKL